MVEALSQRKTLWVSTRTPLIAKKVILLGDHLKNGERTIRELVIFNDEEITDERIAERSRQVQKQIENVRKANANAEKLFEKLSETAKGVTTDGSAWITIGCNNRILRGGGWGDNPRVLRAAVRFVLACQDQSAQDGLGPT